MQLHNKPLGYLFILRAVILIESCLFYWLMAVTLGQRLDGKRSTWTLCASTNQDHPVACRVAARQPQWERTTFPRRSVVLLHQSIKTQTPDEPRLDELLLLSTQCWADKACDEQMWPCTAASLNWVHPGLSQSKWAPFVKPQRHKKHRKECRLHFCLPARMMDLFSPKWTEAQTGERRVKKKQKFQRFT